MAHDPGGNAAPPPINWWATNNGKHGPGPEIPRGAPKGERPVAGNARRLTQGRVVARSAQIDRSPGLARGAQRTQGGLARFANRERRLRVGHDAPRRVPRMHPSATGAPPAPRWVRSAVPPKYLRLHVGEGDAHRLPPCRRARSCPRTHGPDRNPFFTVSNSPKKRIASSDREWQSHRSLAILVLTFRFSLFAYHHPLLLSLFLLASVSLSHSPTPDEERAERRWRSDACEAPVSARHDRRADASSICANRANPPCVHCAPRASPGLRSICANRASKPGLCFPHLGQARHAV